ncbi:hypothetical protein [Scandinavium lactucae]|uniref:Uncharacterized protein n=1 Tax=Scandinavium lactucae TaxID=3095028 RepID=A0ABU4QT13_9ENTR|nr:MULTISPECIES: hypothetical protein [unclassified Scandinavium]MDX6042436.1 hypothetical protein [Scandinavium sp. V105_6]MDX6052437.1 hypothetical protein [Scandinavium sp. V105_1]
MKAKELILTNCFSHRELLEMKNSYVQAIREVYGRGAIVAVDETFENYILVIADAVSSAFFLVTFMGLINVSAMLYIHGLTKGTFAMFVISMFIIIGVVIRNSIVKKIKMATTLKLIKLRVKMFFLHDYPTLACKQQIKTSQLCSIDIFILYIDYSLSSNL